MHKNIQLKNSKYDRKIFQILLNFILNFLLFFFFSFFLFGIHEKAMKFEIMFEKVAFLFSF